MSCRRPRRKQRQRGVALIVALLVFAVCAALSVALQRDFALTLQRSSNRLLSEQAWAYLLGAEDLAKLALRLDSEADAGIERPRDDLGELWAQQGEPYPLEEGGWMVGTLIDLQGRFNLNLLADQPVRGEDSSRPTPAQAMFVRLLLTLPEQPVSEFQAMAVAEAIGDWIDRDDEPRMNGAESAFYTARSPGYLPGNRPMASVSELRAVANVTPELYALLEPLVTVWPQDPGPLNIHTAPPSVLRSINVDGSLQPLSAIDGQRLVQQREESGFSTLDEFLALPVFGDGETSEIAALLGESSNTFLLSARVTIADREQRLYSVLRRESQQITVLQRARGAL